MVTVRVTHTGTEGGHCQGDPYTDLGWSLSGCRIQGLRVVTVRVTHTGTEGGHCQGLMVETNRMDVVLSR